jgi:hypothetical protein
MNQGEHIMATISRTVSWTLLADVDEALAHVQQAVGQTDFEVTHTDRRSVTVDVPRAIMKNRWAAKIQGDVTASPGRTDIDWTVEGLGDKHFEHLASIAEHLPEGLLYDHGIPAAAAKLSNRIFGRKEISHLANILDRDEQVHAIGVGQYVNKAGIVALTDKRLLFLEKSMLGSEDMTDFSLSSIGAISLGKKMTGETLTVTHSGTSAVISALGHGQGDAIARTFRQLKEQQAPAAPGVAAADPIAQIERLAGLHAKGILTDDEFQAQKAQILNRL